MSLIDSLDETNRRIIDDAMQKHDLHYRQLIRWCKAQIKRRGRFHHMTGPAMLGEILCHGHTVCCCIWEKYGGDETK
jgi:hypothetical protein